MQDSLHLGTLLNCWIDNCIVLRLSVCFIPLYVFALLGLLVIYNLVTLNLGPLFLSFVHKYAV